MMLMPTRQSTCSTDRSSKDESSPLTKLALWSLEHHDVISIAEVMQAQDEATGNTNCWGNTTLVNKKAQHRKMLGFFAILFNHFIYTVEVTYTIILFYNYVRIADPKGLMESQRKLCESLGLKGRIIVA